MFVSADRLSAQQSRLYVGTYTDTIHVYNFDTENGALTTSGYVTGVKNPSFMALSDDGQNLYAVSETQKGAVAAFKLRGSELIPINRVGSMGDDPCYVDVHGSMVVVGNYSSGNLSLMTRNTDGSLQPSKQMVKHSGSSANANRQEAPHVHSTRFSADGKRLWVADLGTDKLYMYPIKKGMIDEDSVVETKVADAAAPRHFEFHPTRPTIYLLNELNGNISIYEYNNRGLTEIGSVDSGMERQDDIVGVGSADIHITPNGRFLYTSHRGISNKIVAYAVEENGRLLYLESYDTAGDNPRNFAIDPEGKYLIVANGKSNNIILFKIDQASGRLNRTATEVKVEKPVCLLFSK